MDYLNIVNVIIIVAGILQGIILSMLFFIRKCNNKTANFFLALFIFTLTVQLVLKLATKVWLLHELNFAYWMSYEIPFLHGPLLYCYIKSTLTPLRLFKWNNLLHLIPFFYILLVKTMSTILPDLHLPEFFMPFFVSQPILHGVVQLISIVVYSLASIRLIERYKTGLKQEELIINLVQLKWLKQCIQVVLFSVIGIIIAIKVLWFVYPAHTNWRLVFSGLTILIYWISYKALSNPGIFHFHSNELKLVDYPSHQIMNNNIEVTSTVKYYNSRLGEDQLSDILSSLEELMEQHKLYTDPQITIELLSLRLKISRHHLSQAINDKLNKNFNEFINEYRVKEAMRLLKDTQFDQYTIASIAYSSGFNSLASFNNSFKKYSGITPSGFKKERLSAH